MNKISTENYKGVRDFYPEDYRIQEYIFNVWKVTMKSFGYQQYDSSVLENAEVFRQKSGEEIINEQTYIFKDKGEREVSLRPEMTPVVARMISKKLQTLSFPLRWFSIPNLFRYERPQKGRLREHWQLNVDLFGIDSKYADIEIIEVAVSLMNNFGLDDQKYTIKINDRGLIDSYLKDQGFSEEQSLKIMKLLDKKNKINDFDEKLKEITGNEFVWNPQLNERLSFIISELKARGIENVEFSSEIVRGFDYYTGFIFEIFDTGEKNNRSIFGGGRYDNLVEIFSNEKVPAIGFGMGDVTLKDVLETYDLLPDLDNEIDLYICSLGEDFISPASLIADIWREEGLNVQVDISNKKVGDQIKKASKLNSKFIACIGENEIKEKKITIKNLETRKEKKLKIEKVSEYIIKNI